MKSWSAPFWILLAGVERFARLAPFHAQPSTAPKSDAGGSTNHPQPSTLNSQPASPADRVLELDGEALECGDWSPLSAGDWSPSNVVARTNPAKRSAQEVRRAALRGAAWATRRPSGCEVGSARCADQRRVERRNALPATHAFAKFVPALCGPVVVAARRPYHF